MTRPSASPPVSPARSGARERRLADPVSLMEAGTDPAGVDPAGR